jgi:hypothetical protein
MTLEKAIEELSFWETRFHDYNDPQMTKAVKLGIEALRFRLRWEQQEGDDDYLRLPGETNE